MDTGRIQALILANPTGHVIYERFYSKFGDQERSNIREALYTAGQLAKSPGPGLAAEGCSRFRSASVCAKQTLFASRSRQLELTRRLPV